MYFHAFIATFFVLCGSRYFTVASPLPKELYENINVSSSSVKMKRAIPCTMIEDFKSFNIDLTMPCVNGSDTIEGGHNCSNINMSINFLLNSTVNCSKDAQLSPPSCDALSKFNASLPCRDLSCKPPDPSCSSIVTSAPEGECIDCMAYSSKEDDADPLYRCYEDRECYDNATGILTEDDVSGEAVPEPGLSPPDCAKQSDILPGSITACEDVRNYPKELMLGLVKSKNLESLLKREEYRTEPGESDNRIVYNPACHAQAKILQMQAVKKPSSDWKYVVNVGDYVQAITVDKCSQEYEACAEIDRFLGFGFVSRCVQKRAIRNLFVLSDQSNDLELQRFEFPSACVCEVGQKLS